MLLVWLVCGRYQQEWSQHHLTTAIVHHSNRRSQSASEDYQARLAKAGIRCSMIRWGNFFDNVPVESFFSPLKTELVYQQLFATGQEGRRAIFEYVEVFYNRKQRHSTVGYLSRVEFEEWQRVRPPKAQTA